MRSMATLCVLVLCVFAAVPARAADADSGSNPVLLGPDRVFDRGQLLQNSGIEPASARLQSADGRKDPRLAMLYSLLLPGLGELWLGHQTRATLFFAAEAGIWTAYGVFQHQGSHRKELYQEYASALAGVPIRDDDEFYRIIGNFESSDGPFSANEQIRRQARAIFPNDRAAQEAFLEENGYFGDDEWEWQSEEAFDRYRDMRSRSLDSYNNADLTIGLMVANRLLSILDAGLLAAKRNRELDPGGGTLSWNLDIGPEGPGAQVVLARTF